MSEIEKAREALFTHMLSVQAADDFLRKFESFSRAIAREEIEAAGPWVCGACGAVPSPTCPHRGVAPQCGVLVHAAVNQEGGEANSRLDQTGHDKSPPAVEAPAAGSLQPFGGITIRADEPNIVIEGLGRPDLSIGSELSDMTALARRRPAR